MLKRKKTELGPRGKEFYDCILDEYLIHDTFGKSVLWQAAQCIDRAQECHEILDRDGLTFQDKTGTIRQHPATKVEQMAKVSFCSLMRLVGLDPTLEPK